MKKAFKGKLGGRWTRYNMPSNMNGVSYMDVGCNNGVFVKQAMELGATNVLGTDYATDPNLDPTIPFIQCDIFSDKFLELPRFDIVSCIGLIYHTANPASVVQC